MKNTLKKFIFLMLTLCAVSFGAFALDEDNVLQCVYLGSLSEDEIDTELSDIDTIKDAFMNGLGGSGLTITDFFAINEDNADEEDREMIDVLNAYMDDNAEDLEQDDTYMSVVLRNVIPQQGMDGWVVVTHYDEDDGYLDWVFYFKVEL